MENPRSRLRSVLDAYRITESLIKPSFSGQTGFGWWGMTRLMISKCKLGLIRFGGHLRKGEYDVDHGGHEGQADAPELHG